MRLTIIEGTPKEIMEAAPELLNSLKNSRSEQVVTASDLKTAVQIKKQNDIEDESWEPKYADYDFACSVLDRRELSGSMRTVIKVVGEAYPNYVTANTLMEKLEMSGAQFRGVMGSFGRRVSHTDGYDDNDGQWFFEQEWMEEEGFNKYRLPEAVLKAAKDKGLLD